MSATASVEPGADGSTPGRSSGFPDRSARNRPGFLLWHATARRQRAVAEALTPLELTHTQFVVLAGTAWLEANVGRPGQRDLSEHTGTDAMTASQVIRTLDRRGLVRREEDPTDARVKRLHCTPTGRDLAASAVAALDQVDDGFFGQADARATSLEMLRRLAARDHNGAVVRSPHLG